MSSRNSLTYTNVKLDSDQQPEGRRNSSIPGVLFSTLNRYGSTPQNVFALFWPWWKISITACIKIFWAQTSHHYLFSDPTFVILGEIDIYKTLLLPNFDKYIVSRLPLKGMPQWLWARRRTFCTLTIIGSQVMMSHWPWRGTEVSRESIALRGHLAQLWVLINIAIPDLLISSYLSPLFGCDLQWDLPKLLTEQILKLIDILNQMILEDCTLKSARRTHRSVPVAIFNPKNLMAYSTH